ncbi:FAD-dependent oxidoreductase [Actinocorallia populi]|uniref:FAD-dependent oxidoreductase n=1 Tax=Actinocorallia populi TaxID=2079200 RepID=UPI000D087726|nr:FAD-dependent oxidoreductase [Actinocorallia populi]
MSDTTQTGCCGPAATRPHTAAAPRTTVPAGSTEPPIAVIGAGPVGLAAAAQLAERGLDFTVLEAGDQVGASVRQWGHVGLFSPWRYNTDAAARRLLEAAGWQAPDPETLPTGSQLVDDYLTPLAALPQIAPRLRTGARVEAISRAGYDRLRSVGREDAPFVLRVRTADGSVEQIRARAVIDASGTWRTPNVLGANGLPALGEAEAAAWIGHALPDVLGADRHVFAGRHTLVAGAGHSAATTLIALAELAQTAPGTAITWAIRGADASRTYGGGDADQLPARGRLGTLLHHLVTTGKITLLTGFFTDELRPLADGPEHGGIRVISRAPDGVEQSVTADRIVAATGYRPDHSLTGELRLKLDALMGTTPELAPLIDPNLHSCGTVPPHGVDELTHPESGYHAIGVKSYGRAPTFLLATGYEQARSVTAALAGDWEAARDMRLELPETGVCSSANAVGLGTGISGGLLSLPLVTSGASGSCCG